MVLLFTTHDGTFGGREGRLPGAILEGVTHWKMWLHCPGGELNLDFQGFHPKQAEFLSYNCRRNAAKVSVCQPGTGACWGRVGSGGSPSGFQRGGTGHWAQGTGLSPLMAFTVPVKDCRQWVRHSSFDSILCCLPRGLFWDHLVE